MFYNEKKHIKVEHINTHLKQYKRLSIRYNNFYVNYSVFIHLAYIDIIMKYITLIDNNIYGLYGISRKFFYVL